MEEMRATDIGYNFLISRNYLIEGVGFDFDTGMRTKGIPSLYIRVFVLEADRADDLTLLQESINRTILDGQVIGKISRNVRRQGITPA